MSEEAARIVVWSLIAVAVVAWFLGARSLAQAYRWRQSRSEDSFSSDVYGDPQSGWRDPVTPGEVTGQVNVEAPQAGLATRLARVLAQPATSGLGNVKIERADETSVEFDQIDVPGSFRMQHGLVQFVRLDGNRTQALYRVEFGSGRGLLIAAQAILIAALVAIVGVAIVMEKWVIPSAEPGIRWQAVQTCQLVHLLWPPFMLSALYRRGRESNLSRLETLLVNLPHQD